MPPETTGREPSVRRAGSGGLRRRWRVLRLLRPGERRLALGALVALPVVEVGLRLLGLRRLLAVLEKTVPEPTGELVGDSEQHRGATAAARLIAAVGRGGFARITCLRQAVLLWWVLRRRGIDCVVRLGVTREERGISAHAWVESGGIVLETAGESAQRFRALREPLTAGGG